MLRGHNFLHTSSKMVPPSSILAAHVLVVNVILLLATQEKAFYLWVRCRCNNIFRQHTGCKLLVFKVHKLLKTENNNLWRTAAMESLSNKYTSSFIASQVGWGRSARVPCQHIGTDLAELAVFDIALLHLGLCSIVSARVPHCEHWKLTKPIVFEGGIPKFDIIVTSKRYNLQSLKFPNTARI